MGLHNGYCYKCKKKTIYVYDIYKKKCICVVCGEPSSRKHEGFLIRTRKCKYCGEWFKTKKKYAEVCTNCKKRKYYYDILEVEI